MTLRSDRRRWRRLALASSAVLVLAACASPDDGNGVEEVTSLTGTITGTILDSNGSPVVGATVRYSGAAEENATLEVVTDSIGQFQMPGVTVSGLAGASSNDANGPLTLVVVPPAGYMGATVEVTPEAQSTGSVGGGTLFIDNFNVGIGSLKLPALNTGVSGVLRSASTGAPIDGATLRLDFKGTEFDQDGEKTGVATTYDSGANRQAVTAADGSFSFADVYADACVNLSISNMALVSVSGSAPPCPTRGAASDSKTLNLATTDDGGTINLSTVSAEYYASGDVIAPYVSSVDGVVDVNESPAQLESSVKQQLRVRFSETLQAGLLDLDDVTVALGSPRTATPVDSVSLEGGNTVVIDLAQALPQSTAVTIVIAREALKDTGGNSVANGPAVAFDGLEGQNLVLLLQSFGASNGIADAPTVTQVDTQAIAGDPAFLATNALLDTVDPSTTDIRSARTPEGSSIAYPSEPAVEQLNAAGSGGVLSALLAALVPGDSRTVLPGAARVHVVAPSNAVDFAVWVERSGQNIPMLFFPVSVGSGNPQNSANIGSDGSTYAISPNGATQFDLIVRSRNSQTVDLQPGDVLHVASRNGAGVLGGTATLTLEDNSPPTVALQLARTVSATAPRSPLVAITPQAVDVNDSESGFAGDNWRGTTELQGLSNSALRGSSFAGTLESGNQAIGDATGTSSFLGTAVTFGLVLTEPVELTGTAPTLGGITTTLSNYAVVADALNEDGSLSDLLTFRVANLFQLASDASAQTASIDITPAVRDVRGLVPDAGTRAKSNLQDLMPPLMTLAFYDGSFFVFRFNEPVRKAGIIRLRSCNTDIDVSQAAVQQIDDRTFKVPASLVSSGIGNGTLCFQLPAYSESAYSKSNLGSLTATTPAASPEHGVVSYTSIPDRAATPNTWDDWEARGLGIGAPYFAMADIRQ
jgi:hypothetical protein